MALRNHILRSAAVTMMLAAALAGCAPRNDYETAVWQRDSAWQELTGLREELAAAKKSNEQTQKDFANSKASLEEQKLQLERALRNEIEASAKLNERAESLSKESAAAARDRDDAKALAQTYQDAIKAQAAQIQQLQQSLAELRKTAVGTAGGAGGSTTAATKAGE